MPRPLSIMIVSAFLFFATVIAAVVGVSLLFPNPLLDQLWKFNPEGAVLFHSIGRVSGVFLIALGSATFVAARGLLRGRGWAWWFAVVLFAVNAAGDVVSYLLVRDAPRAAMGVVVASIFIYLLCRYDVRRYLSESR